MDPKDDKIFINPGDMAGDPIKEGSLEDDLLALARVGLHAAQHPMRRGTRISDFDVDSNWGVFELYRCRSVVVRIDANLLGIGAAKMCTQARVVCI